METEREVRLEEKGTIMYEFQKARTDAMSEMFDRDGLCGTLHSTSELYAALDEAARSAIAQARLEERLRVVEEIKHNSRKRGAVAGGTIYEVMGAFLDDLSAQSSPE